MNAENRMVHTYRVDKDDYTKAGEVSSTIKGMLKQLGIDAALVRRIAIACYEAEMNLVIHSHGGNISVSISEDDLLVIVKDSGPGIADVNQALVEGFSTAPESAREMGFGAGMGLPNMKRCADTFDIESALGLGTAIKLGFNIEK